MGDLRAAQRRADEGIGNREGGSILVLFSLLLTLFLLCCAIVIDVGYWWVAGKRAQIAADACALAAAQELPKTYADIGNCAIQAGEGDYVLVNLPDQSLPDPEPLLLSTRVRSPYESDSNMVEATVRMRVRTFFGRVVGLEWIDLTRRAVARKQELDSKMAIYSASPDCDDGFLFGGKRIQIAGYVHSNGQYKVDSADMPDHLWAQKATYAPKNCTQKLDPSPTGARYGGTYANPGPLFEPEIEVPLPWPEWFTPGQFGWNGPADSTPSTPVPGTCTYKGAVIVVDTDNLTVVQENGDKTIYALEPDPDPSRPTWKVVPTGTYCATKTLNIGGEKHSGQITALAPEIQLGGLGQYFIPYAFDMLFFSVPNITFFDDEPEYDPTPMTGVQDPPNPPCDLTTPKKVELNGRDYRWEGVLFNPCGEVRINSLGVLAGSTENLVGTIYGFSVEINGDDFNMIGTGSTAESFILSLVE
jgi:hypothetical protein